MSKYKAPLIALSETAEGLPTKIQLLKAGQYYDSRYGKFQITEDLFLSMIKNFDSKVTNLDVAIDFSHDNHKEAAGWVLGLSTNDNGTELWADVSWTGAGKEKVMDKQFRYVSSEFEQNYLNNETMQKFGPTLTGVGLTNRPVIKGMDPLIQLSEYNEKEFVMDEKDKMIEQLKAEIEALKSKLKGDSELGEMKKELEEKDEENKMLSEKLSLAETKNKELEEEKAKAEKVKSFEVMLSEGKAVEAQRDAFMTDNFTEFTKNAQPIKLSTVGHGNVNEEKKYECAQDEVIALAEAKQKEKNIDFNEAINIVFSENKELENKYYEEVKL